MTGALNSRSNRHKLIGSSNRSQLTSSCFTASYFQSDRESSRNTMTECQAICATGTSGYFVIRFSVDQCVSAKMIMEPPAGTLSVGDACIVRWSDGCRYESQVLRIAPDYATAKRYEAEQLPASPPPKKAKLDATEQLPASYQPKKAKLDGIYKAQKKKTTPSKKREAPPPSKKEAPPPPKRKNESDKFTMEVGSPPLLRKPAPPFPEVPPPKEPGPPSPKLPLPLPKKLAEWYLAPNTLDYTVPPPENKKMGVDGEGTSLDSSTSGSDVILCSEENIITVNVNSSTQIDTSAQADLMPSCTCKCDLVMEN